MKYFIACLFLLAGCSKSSDSQGIFDADPAATPAIYIQPTPEKIDGKWYISRNGGGEQFTITGGQFTHNRYFSGLSLGGAPAYILVRYTGTIALTPNEYIFTYLTPGCVSGRTFKVALSKIDKTSGRLLIEYFDDNATLELVAGNAEQGFASRSYIETGNCRYAELKTSKRIPASVNKNKEKQ
jgi:hypothetical protein